MSNNLEKGPEVLTSKDFLSELKKIGYNKEKAKDAVYKGALTEKGGYKLTKAEALVATGEITNLADLDNAAAHSLESQDIDAFLDQYGGDKYVKRLFEYGMSKMSRDFMARKQNFEADKKKGGAFEGLEYFKTFEEAFDAGFYEGLKVDFGAIMEKGLTISEYRQRDERFRKLERKVKKIEQEQEKYSEGELSGAQQESKEKKMEVKEEPSTLKPSPDKPIKRIFQTPKASGELSEKQKEEMEKERKLNLTLIKLGEVAEAYRQSDIMIPALVKKYGLEEISGELGITPLTENPEKKDDYMEKFMTKVKVEKYVGQMGKTWFSFVDDIRGLGKEATEELTGGYNNLVTDRLEKLVALETGLYVKGDGSSDPRTEIPKIEDEGAREAQESIRQADIKAAEAACPEIKEVQTLTKDLSKAVANWRLEALKLKTE